MVKEEVSSVGVCAPLAGSGLPGNAAVGTAATRTVGGALPAALKRSPWTTTLSGQVKRPSGPCVLTATVVLRMPALLCDGGITQNVLFPVGALRRVVNLEKFPFSSVRTAWLLNVPSPPTVPST